MSETLENPVPCPGLHTCFVHQNMFTQKKGCIDLLTAPKGYKIIRVSQTNVGDWVKCVLEVVPPEGYQPDLL